MNVLRVAGVQFNIAWENKRENFTRVHGLLLSNPPAKYSLVALPEMFATGFSMNAGTIAEDYGGETECYLSNLAKEFEIYLIGGVAMRNKKGAIRNKALVFSPSGDLVCFYAKMRTFTPGGESDFYASGSKPAVFPWNDAQVAPLICYDLRFPELFRATAATHRPELFVLIANWPEKRSHHWTPLLQARAIENQAYVVAVNRVGSDPFQSYAGESMVIDPQGKIVAHAGHVEGIITAELDIPSLREYREKLPFLADLKPR